MGNLNMAFYHYFVMYWNPCPTCRRRYWQDMHQIAADLKPEQEEFSLIFHQFPQSDNPIVDLWVYHNEVSMRLQAGMERDLGKYKANHSSVKDWTDKPAI